MLQVRGVSRQFGGVRALDDMSLEVAAGELACVIGPNGCGKTTLLNVVTGQVAPSGGEVELDGVSLLGRRPDAIARLGVARKFQVPSIFEDLTVRENLGVARAASGRGRALPELTDVLADIHLEAEADQPAGGLSHGAKQWLEIGMLLAQAPRLMLLDEPTAGMSRAETAATAGLLRQLRERAGVAIVVVEHDMQFVEALGARVVVMIAGRVVGDGRYEDVRRLPAVREAYLGAHA